MLKDVVEGQALQAVILASGAEVEIALKAQGELAAQGVGARVVSMLSMEVFGAQDAAYQASVLPAGVKRVAIEAAHPMSWYKWVGTDGAVVGIETFGASAPFQKLYEEYRITAAAVMNAIRGVF